MYYFASTVSQHLFLIRDEEGRELARKAREWRDTTPVLTWQSLYRSLSTNAFLIFKDDFGDFDVVNDPDLAINRESWVRAKADLAFQVVTADPYPFPGVNAMNHDLADWAGWGFDHLSDALPGFDGLQQERWVPFNTIHRIAVHFLRGRRDHGLDLSGPACSALGARFVNSPTPSVQQVPAAPAPDRSCPRIDMAPQRILGRIRVGRLRPPRGQRGLPRRRVPLVPAARILHQEDFENARGNLLSRRASR